MKRCRLQRKTPLKAKTGLTRSGPIKPKCKPAKPAAERAHLAVIAAMPCLACGAPGPSTVHHVTSDCHKRIARSDRRVVPLCPKHHQIQWGPRESVEALGHSGFRERYGIDLLKEADRLWEGSNHD